MAIDVKGDWELDPQTQDLATVDKLAAYEQRLEIRLCAHQGEWAFDLLFGLPWLSRVLGKSPTTGAFRQLLAAEVQQDPDTQTVGEVRFSVPDPDRKVFVSIDVLSVFGGFTTLTRDLS